MSLFKKATRSQTKLRMAITGPAGSGKTLGALLIAKGIVGKNGKIAVIDTENNSASYYSDILEFDTASMNPPYLIDKYIKAIEQAIEAKYNCLIIDSLSHAWAGEGGLLQQKELMDQRGGNSFVNWGKFTPQQNRLVSAVLNCPINLICTMRSKTEYTLTENEKGKAQPKKLGMAPVQRDGFEYEFDVVLDIDLDTHTAKASKDRLGLFTDRTFQISEKVGEAIAKWQSSGSKPEPQQAATPQLPPETKKTEHKKDYIITFGKYKGLTFDDVDFNELTDYANYTYNSAMEKNDVKPFLEEFMQRFKEYSKL